MKNVWMVKALDFKKNYDCYVKTAWSLVDLPFNMRTAALQDVTIDKLPITFDNDEQIVVFIDKLSMLKKVIDNMDEDILKTLTIIINPMLKNVNQIADVILVRYNRVFVVEFCYEFITITNRLDLKESKVIYVLQQIEQNLRRFLPTDSVVRTFLFKIKDDNQNYLNGMRLASEIDDFFSRTTAKELLKMIV